MTLHEIFEEPVWPENPRSLISPFSYGRYVANIHDFGSGRLIHSRGFDTMFAEYVTTKPALDGVKRVFQTVVRCPFPKAKIRVQIESRSKQNVLTPVFETTIDPSSHVIRRETVPQQDLVIEIQNLGSCHDQVDVLFLAEGYTLDDSDKFKGDLQRMTDFMFSQEPYRDLKDRFNIRGLFRASSEQGTDEPRQHRFKSTALNSTYNIFDIDRYLLLEDNHAMHRMAAQVPYDTIVVLVNTKRYGGGGICLDYCAATVDHAASPLVFLHEFGHSFAYLADEYTGDVSYNDMFPVGVEPIEPNITRELNRDRIKWKAFLTPDVALPTPNPEDDVIRLQAELKAGNTATRKKLQAAASEGLQDTEIQTIKDTWNVEKQTLEEMLMAAQQRLPETSGIVGAFEGGGYLKKGIYRAEQSCWMGSLDPETGFCVVCQDAIRRMIVFHSDRRGAITVP